MKGSDAVELVGEARAGEVGLDLGEDGGAEVDGVSVLARARVMATRMRWISDCSSSSRRTSSLFCSMVSSGSTKTVCPEEDEPWMTPGTLR